MTLRGWGGFQIKHFVEFVVWRRRVRGKQGGASSLVRVLHNASLKGC